MPRRSASPRKTKACGQHKAYRSEYEAAQKAAWHPVSACDRCRRGLIWHLWHHGDHVHVGHSSVRAMSA
jgi:hypothetical protein